MAAWFVLSKLPSTGSGAIAALLVSVFHLTPTIDKQGQPGQQQDSWTQLPFPDNPWWQGVLPEPQRPKEEWFGQRADIKNDGQEEIAF